MQTCEEEDQREIQALRSENTRLHAELAELRLQHALLRSTVESMPIGVVVLDGLTDEILCCNHRFCEIWGLVPLEEQLRGGGLKGRDLAAHSTARVAYPQHQVSGILPPVDAQNAPASEDEVALTDGRVLRRLSIAVRDAQGRCLGRACTFEDVTACRQAEATRRESEERLRLALQGSSIGILDWDVPAGEMHFVRTLPELLGYDPEGAGEMSGRAWLERVHPDDLPLVEQAVAAHLLGETPSCEAEVRVLARSGEWRWMLFRGKAVARGNDGRPLRIVAMYLDVTERKLAEEAQHRVQEMAEESRLKDQFLAVLAHELRNPLGTIASSLQVIRLQRGSDPALRPPLEIAERQMRHMSRLLEDLLDVSRISRGKVELKKERVDLLAVTRHAVQAVGPLLEANGQTLSTSLPAQPLWMEADPIRLEQILANLLGNAVKFTPSGGKIWLSVQREGGDAVVQVRDDGAGIPPELLPRVFDTFLQVRPSKDGPQGGLGLGLTLVRKLVALHGGSVQAHSEGAGKGSEFSVRLPALPDERLAPGDATGGASWPPPPDLAAASPHSARNVLLVDDNVDAVEMLGLVIETWGHRVTVAHDGPSALAALPGCSPDVIILDIGMPGMDGYEVARCIRRMNLRQRPLIIALTGFGQESDRQMSRAAGFDHHLVKPVEPAELERLINDFRP